MLQLLFLQIGYFVVRVRITNESREHSNYWIENAGASDTLAVFEVPYLRMHQQIAVRLQNASILAIHSERERNTVNHFSDPIANAFMIVFVEGQQE